MEVNIQENNARQQYYDSWFEQEQGKMKGMSPAQREAHLKYMKAVMRGHVAGNKHDGDTHTSTAETEQSEQREDVNAWGEPVLEHEQSHRQRVKAMLAQLQKCRADDHKAMLGIDPAVYSIAQQQPLYGMACSALKRHCMQMTQKTDRVDEMWGSAYELQSGHPPEGRSHVLPSQCYRSVLKKQWAHDRQMEKLHRMPWRCVQAYMQKLASFAC